MKLAESGSRFADIGELAGKRIGLTRNEIEEYLEGFNYTLGERERAAMAAHNMCGPGSR